MAGGDSWTEADSEAGVDSGVDSGVLRDSSVSVDSRADAASGAGGGWTPGRRRTPRQGGLQGGGRLRGGGGLRGWGKFGLLNAIIPQLLNFSPLQQPHGLEEEPGVLQPGPDHLGEVEQHHDALSHFLHAPHTKFQDSTWLGHRITTGNGIIG